MFLPFRLREALTLGGLSVRELIVRTWHKVEEHEVFTRAAAVAFYAMLALVPFLGLVLTLVVQLLPDLTGRSGNTVGVANLTVEQLDSTLRTMFPKEAYGVIKDQIVRIQKDSHLGLISLGLAVTIWLASSLFLAVIDAMNRIYGVTETRPFWKLRLTAIVMTLIQAIILVGSLLAIVAWPQILSWLGLSTPAQIVATIIQWVVVFLMVSVSFALTFYNGPDAQQRWEWITPGSVVGTFAFMVQTFGFRIYVQNFANYNQAYGSLGGVMVLLFWFWISSVVVLTAAEQNKIIEDASPLGKTYGQKVDPPSSPDFEEMKPELSSREPGA
ncbi:membrane protein [Singulisphaera sp. GP187]|uniref:YihY/virulence factor BrkB family protein n=1 Tax=Singulisphaera sp. GP187 TaxID=1882752 RepID=UPI0009282659|nr:YihY/virulence factor BrkB family protein [Singulisphaera sp. GP187]SIO66742.1 membrane protein [Singulisphaera sp. GP187]